ncbi:MAG: hypothetical protein C4527_15130 [Candidatus Omnitrophota bacterium]|jgi:hypothetical protein|nr:MAG: hypothetical protein C4527_15130 [Candidatus Omnitrophota bacterium]
MSTALAVKFNPDFERQILSSILYDPSNVERCGALCGADFCNKTLGKIYQAACDIYRDGGIVDDSLIIDRCGDVHINKASLYALRDEYVTDSNLDFWVSQVQDYGRRLAIGKLFESAAKRIEQAENLSDFTTDVIGKLQAISGVNPTDSTEKTAWPEPLPPEAYIGLLGEITKFIEPETEADPAGILAQLLVVFGNAIGRNPYFFVESDFHYANEFLCLVGETSTAGKGTSWGYIRRLFKDALPDYFKNRVEPGLSSGEGLIHKVRDATEVAGEITDPGMADKRLLVTEGEFASLLQAMNRPGNRVSTIIREAWDYGDLGTMTRNNPQRATGAHISIITHITFEELRKTFKETDCLNGFGNRFLWVCVKRQRCLPEGGNVDFSRRQQYIEKLQRAVEFAQGHSAEVPFDIHARELWHAIYPKLTQARAGLSGAMLARSAPHVRRLALIYALSDFSSVVEEKHLQASLEFWEYVEQSVEYIFGDHYGNRTAEKIINALRDSPEGLSETAISRDVFGGNKNYTEINHAIESLKAAGKIRTEKRRTSERGRAATIVLRSDRCTKETKETKEMK